MGSFKHYTTKYIFVIFLGLLNILEAQDNTIGTILNTSDAQNGYTLFTPNTNTLPNATYLINNCGEVINQWLSNFKGQGADLLMPDGSLFRACVDNQSTLNYPGNTGRIEKYDWDGNLLWGYTHSDINFSFHHDYFPLPNGNILMIVVERKTNVEAIQAGRNPALLSEGDLYNEKIIEIQPIGNNDASIVWEWSLWDHLVQDFDNTKDNFGDIANSFGRLNINFLDLFGDQADWSHFNSMDYNETLDQVLISARHTSEIYIIDHSITTGEATTIAGDFMYRWGNQKAYNQGDDTNQKLYGQHSVHWIPNGLPNEGKIMIFNNGFSRGFTTIETLEPQLDGANNYVMVNAVFEPSNAEIIYSAPNPSDFYAAFLSSAYELENGNILINNGPIGELFEVGTSNTIVWNYISPILINGTTLSQGDAPGGVNSRFYRARKYSTSYSAFDGRDLTPSSPIELNPVLSNCEILSNHAFTLSATNTTVYPNPAVTNLNVATLNSELLNFSVFTVQGKLVFEGQISNQYPINISSLNKGLYFIKLTNNNYENIVIKFIKS